MKGAEPLDAYYGFYTLAMGRGEPRTVAELGRLQSKAGFGHFRLLRNRMPVLTSILVARPAVLRMNKLDIAYLKRVNGDAAS